jgi:hypothetical protein
MAIKTFTTGEVLTAADTNTYLANSGLVYVYNSSFAGVTSFSLPTGTFTSAFRNYRITYNIAVSTDSRFSVRLRKNGTDNTTTTYNTMLRGILSTGAAADNPVNSATSWSFGEQDSTLDFYASSFDLYQPQLNTRTSATGNLTFVNLTATASVGQAGGWYSTTQDQYDSISFISDAANSMTGVVRVSGYRD